MYNTGAVRNAEIALDLFPDWVCRYHCSSCVPEATLIKLRSLPNTQLIPMDEAGSYRGLFWRFFPASDQAVEVMLSRDCDSRLEIRELRAVEEFLRSGRTFHVMRDHPYHNVPILGGMFGVKRPALEKMREWILESTEYRPENARLGCDQDFLARKVWPLVRDSCIIHDEIHSFNPWPVRQSGHRFVGQAFNENDTPLYPEHCRPLPKPDFTVLRIDLRSIPVMVVSSRKFPERQQSILRTLREIGFKPPVIFQDEYGRKSSSVSQNHLSALSVATPPFLVLEDDAEPMRLPLQAFIDVPVDTAALYLGTSHYGFAGNRPIEAGVVAIGEPSMPRVLNMLGSHAILYLHIGYVAAVRSVLHALVESGSDHAMDTSIAAVQPCWNVRALNPPLFYQNDGWSNAATSIPLCLNTGCP